MRTRSVKSGQGKAKESLPKTASACVLKGLRGETCRLDGACGDENSSAWEDAGGAGVAVDRMERYDQAVGGELFDLDFVAVETPALGFFKTGVQSVDYPAEELVAHPSDDESISKGLVDCFVSWVG